MRYTSDGWEIAALAIGAGVMTNKQHALFQATAFDSLYKPPATMRSPCAGVASRSIQITPVPIKATSSNLMHPRAGKGDNK